MHYTRTAVVALATVVLSLGALPVAAHAAKPGSDPCAKEQQQVAKAQAALAQVTADKKKKKPKAQLQRLAQAQERLAACQAEAASQT